MNHHEKFMKQALLEAEKAKIAGEVPIGAVIVKDNKIISRGYNQCETLHDATAHAEIIAIKAASINDWRLTGCEIYVTLEPCMMCMGAIINARLSKVYFGAYNNHHDVCSNVSLAQTSQKYNIDIFPLILNRECKQIIDSFFESKR